MKKHDFSSFMEQEKTKVSCHHSGIDPVGSIRLHFVLDFVPDLST